MFSGGVPKKVIEEITGHQSDAAHLYECTSESVKQKASSTLSWSASESNVKEPKFELVSPNMSPVEKFAQKIDDRKKNMKIDVHKCIESAGVMDVLDSVNPEKVKSVKITIEIEYKDDWIVHWKLFFSVLHWLEKCVIN